jgi:hypothetical protein
MELTNAGRSAFSPMGLSSASNQTTLSLSPTRPHTKATLHVSPSLPPVQEIPRSANAHTPYVSSLVQIAHSNHQQRVVAVQTLNRTLTQTATPRTSTSGSSVLRVFSQCSVHKRWMRKTVVYPYSIHSDSHLVLITQLGSLDLFNSVMPQGQHTLRPLCTLGSHHASCSVFTLHQRCCQR